MHPNIVAIALLTFASYVWGHGRLIEPPSRASAWRYGFQTPPNYNDHELYCGGYARQWGRNGGKCGECGDAYDMPKPRPHELGGRWGQGIIVRKYQVNAVMLIRVELTASHNGYFEFRICPNAPATTQDCLDKNLLSLVGVDNPDTKFYPKNGSRVYEIRAQLPRDLTCGRCVLQWRYVAGNNWGECPGGGGAVGCGPQEEFRACSDISIGTTSASVPVRPTRPGVFTTTENVINVNVNTTSTTPLEKPEEDSFIIGFIIALIMLLVVLCGLSLFYLYYYQGGDRIKNLLRKKPKQKDAAPISGTGPVPPPRLKKAAKEINDNDNIVKDFMEKEDVKPAEPDLFDCNAVKTPTSNPA